MAWGRRLESIGNPPSARPMFAIAAMAADLQCLAGRVDWEGGQRYIQNFINAFRTSILM